MRSPSHSGGDRTEQPHREPHRRTTQPTDPLLVRHPITVCQTADQVDDVGARPGEEPAGSGPAAEAGVQQQPADEHIAVPRRADEWADPGPRVRRPAPPSVRRIGRDQERDPGGEPGRAGQLREHIKGSPTHRHTSILLQDQRPRTEAAPPTDSAGRLPVKPEVSDRRARARRRAGSGARTHRNARLTCRRHTTRTQPRRPADRPPSRLRRSSAVRAR